MQSDEVTRQKEPERLKQIEAIREQATMLHGSRLNGDKPSEESIVKIMRESVNEYMAAVDQDKEDGLDPGHGPAVEGASARDCGPCKPRHASGWH
jgi:hypothetical protein